jgi:hypothetical protein
LYSRTPATVVTVSARDGIRVLGSRNDVAQSSEPYDSVHAERPVFFCSSSPPDHGHRIVRFAGSVVAGKHRCSGIRFLRQSKYDAAARALPVASRVSLVFHVMSATSIWKLTNEFVSITIRKSGIQLWTGREKSSVLSHSRFAVRQLVLERKLHDSVRRISCARSLVHIYRARMRNMTANWHG